MTLLILSDIHANWPALEAVLAEEADHDAVVFCGDVVDYGPQPVECLRWLAMHADHFVRGNHDNALAQDIDCHCMGSFREYSLATRAWHRTLLSESDFEFLRRMPAIDHFEWGGQHFRMAHATPQGDLFEYLDAEQWGELVAEIASQIDWQCDFDDQGMCEMARNAPSGEPSPAQIVGNNCRNCCCHCSANRGFLEKIPKEAVAQILPLFDPVLGFWAQGRGCALPWKWRSHVCLGFSCRSEPESLRALVTEFRCVTGTSPWRPTLNDRQIVELREQLARDGMFKPPRVKRTPPEPAPVASE